jgi:ADP-ribosyl-[dinitrogen reductase] hydrolase
MGAPVVAAGIACGRGAEHGQGDPAAVDGLSSESGWRSLRGKRCCHAQWHCGRSVGHDPEKRRAFTLAACRLTHTDPRAEESAVLVAEATVLAGAKAELSVILDALRPLVTSEEMKSRWEQLERALVNQLSVLDYATQIGCERGVSGFAPNTVAVALFAWLRHRGNFADTLSAVISCGGDTDTVAAIAGGICGAEVGLAGIPQPWIDGICDWPRSTKYIQKLATAFASNAGSPPPFLWFMAPLRNLVFLVIVLAHGVRRLFPQGKLKL